MNNKPAKFSIAGVILAILAALFSRGGGEAGSGQPGSTTGAPAAGSPAAGNSAAGNSAAGNSAAGNPAGPTVGQPTVGGKEASGTAPAAKPTPAAPVPDKPAAKPPATNPPKPEAPKPAPATNKPAEQKPAATGPPPSTSKVGFTSRASWQSHFEKHGAEFGKITADEYLERAKALRDAPLSKDVLELVRDDGVISRFDKRTGGFVAFHEDKTIRTFFRPNDGEAYFRRQANR